MRGGGGVIQSRDALRPIVREQKYLMNCNFFYLFLMIMDSWRQKKRIPYKLRCYKRISSPAKSRNNTREKISYFFTCVWYRQSATDTSFAFRTTRSGWWMNGKAFTIQDRLSEFFGLWLLKHCIAHSQWHWNFPRNGRKPKYGTKNRKFRIRIQRLW